MALHDSLLDSPVVSSDARTRMQQVAKRRKELSERVHQLKLKEHVALLRLSKINTQLSNTTHTLNQHKTTLQSTDRQIGETEHIINNTQTAEQNLSCQAAKRLREIYEGQRVSFLEMILQVDSLQTLLDRFYFQARVADQDRNLLQALRAKEAKLNARKDQLGDKRNKLGDLVSTFAQMAMQIAREKLQQQQVADKLRGQRAFYEQAEQQLAQESHRLEAQIQEMESSNRRNNKNVVKGSGALAMPLHAPVTSPFGWRKHPIFGVRKFHTGVDLAGKNHSPIRAADSGTVLFTGWYGGYGKVAIISHGDGMATLYAHMSKVACNVGDNVSKGDLVGFEGTTGFSTGPHLHFEVRVNGKPNNPLNFVH
ncbi:MAG TPA: peptidoglycan DD-metalloendopeptidase family protein [Chroococcales cyanobacterium]